MKLTKTTTTKAIADLIGGEVLGDPDKVVSGINEIHKVESGDLTFVDVEKYYRKVLKSAANTILINKKIEWPEGKTLIYVEDPFSAYNKLVRHFAPFQALNQTISDTAVVHPSAIIEPNVVLGHHVTVGAYSRIRANAVIHDNTKIGANVIIHSGTIVGTDAFYYKSRPDHLEKMLSCGRVIIEDHVEIGACCTIDRGVSGDTIIGEGTKLDNQVHVGHGVVIGKRCIIAAQVGIAGKTILCDGVKLWGQVGVSARLRIGDGVEVFAQSGVSSNLKANKQYFGAPAIEAKEWFSDYRASKRLPRELNDLRKKME